MKPSELLDSHAAAGTRYDLAGHDMALDNKNVPVGPTPVRSFFGIPDSIPWPLRHGQFAPDGGMNWQDASRARGNELINSVKA
ncbi:hypothetical protein MesoLj131b_32520 [Mesorhizobium sp. 131-2-5]|uniref:hypothetical protein n=1 Tax=Mesorhizobium sp. 131-2-5 TaxID=2744519 RepID=UPI0019264D7F|nr:hypothetical protein [Mesorhizobium sp. 131-2-5]BCH01253.1 hypothetical protein MesoLj131b_32520 [Mesorhizobium sp. 131-2-5]